jgi:hypothetical protein
LARGDFLSELDVVEMDNGWGARIRTWECRYQKPVPYRLATPQQIAGEQMPAPQIAA